MLNVGEGEKLHFLSGASFCNAGHSIVAQL